ncbi:Spo7-like protein-domain-containing protein [Neohortaea acidophila]|uniref:Spo7-like protein-domain-containing protein n=1 Tax=Neohortaea acidophila TaxID=245834 RepID=A0A6A6PJ41_9PEZI|nr:Spo7-like protein-domain-containing protein [Neohortaea acidophila]KAF2479731.1 Spo7-like protein-domain-containing protein [Neohortaea acidophila]
MATSESKLDQIVKGVPPPNVSPAQIAASAKASSPTNTTNTNRPIAPQLPHSSTITDPRDALPSSPPQIYLNLLILESSLRLQYLSLRARLRVNLLLLLTLLLWNWTFTYLLFFRPREDGSGVGGSVYWAIETIEKLGWCSGIVTLCLFWGTGMYERGVRWPRKFVGTTNRGLRGFNMKVVVVRDSFFMELWGWLGVLDPLGWFRDDRVQFQVLPKDIEATGGGGKEQHWNHHASRHGLVEEDIAPSGDVLKVLLLPKPFSPDFREGWETYRLEYWERENARRAELRKLYHARIREVARREGGWLWWTGWRGWNRMAMLGNAGKSRRQIELEKIAVRPRVSHEAVKERRKNSLLLRHPADRADSHSRSSSRSTTPTPDPDSPHGRPRKPGERERTRRGSSTGSQKTRLKKLAAPPSSRLSASGTVLQNDEVVRPLEKRASTISISSKESEESVPLKKDDADGGVEIKVEPPEA